MTKPPDRLLRISLRGNAAFSAGCGATSLAMAGPLAESLGIPAPELLTGLGVQLLVFAGLVALLASRAVVRPSLALAVIAADVLWVVGTIPLLSFGVLTPAGNATAFAVAFAVGSLAALQFAGVRRVRSSLQPAVCFQPSQ